MCRPRARLASCWWCAYYLTKSAIAACREAGITPEHVVTGRGPFSVEENRALLRQLKIGVLVTKDSGKAGGVPEKLEAAEAEHCRVVIIQRPEPAGGQVFGSVAELVEALKSRLRSAL